MDGGEERLTGSRRPRSGSERSSISSTHSAPVPMTLPDRFAELMLVVGIDDNTGLVPLGAHGIEVKTKI